MRKLLLLSLCLVAAVLAGAAPSGDPEGRIELMRLHLAGDSEATLDKIAELAAAENPAIPGLPYLEARLQLAGGDRPAAIQGFTEVLAEAPRFAPWARYRLALLYEEEGHFAVAAGVAASLLGAKPPRTLVHPTVALLERNLGKTGDCRVLRGLASLRLDDRERRRLSLARAACARRDGDVDRERQILADLLVENTRDDPAHVASERLLHLVDPERLDPGALEDLALAFYHHRLFERSTRLLEATVATGSGAVDLDGARYALARSHFWLGHYDRASAIFAHIADTAPGRVSAAKARYQEARCHELAGSRALDEGSRAAAVDFWRRAAAVFGRAAAAAPDTSWGSAGLGSRLRLLWLLGEREEALKTLEKLERKSRSRHLAQSRIFLAVSDLVEGRTDRAGPWLRAVQGSEHVPEVESSYWLGRLGELDGRPREAVRAYVEVLKAGALHPFGVAAQKRLGSESLAPHARRHGLLASGVRRPDEPEIRKTDEELYEAFLLLGEEHPVGAAAERALRRRLGKDAKARPFLEMAPVPPEAWPLWQKRLETPAEQLLALGLFDEPGAPVRRHFPVSRPDLALTGSLALGIRGATHRSMYIVEVLRGRVPRRVPEELLPKSYRETLYPFRYRDLILGETEKQGVDPYLLAGLIREESRFDPDAFSGASARGLTQFVVPTARKIAAAEKMGEIAPADLHRPEIAVALGAAYLRRLLASSEGELPAAVSAYNAGEPQSRLWQHYCLGDEPEEYISKVVFRETRAYVRKVLSSRAQYEVLYGEEDA